jgi:heme exporter protein D
MNAWAFWTWAAVVVLTFGSVAVFVWFLVDLVRIRREVLDDEREDGRP